MARKRITLDSWIHEALTDKDKDGPCTMLSLVHMVGNVEREIHTKQIAPGSDVREIAQMFQNKADAYAQDLPGGQIFCLLAFYAGRKEAGSRHPFNVQGDYGESGLGTYSPDARGEKQLGMNGIQAMMGLMLNQTRTLFEAGERMIGSMSAREERLVRENSDALVIVKELLLKEVQTSHDMRIKEMEYKRSTEERQLWLKMAPMLANTLTGKDIFPQSSADTGLIEGLLDKLCEMDDQKRDMAIGLISQMVGNELMGPLMMRLNQALDKRKKAAEDETKALPAPTNPDDELH